MSHRARSSSVETVRAFDEFVDAYYADFVSQMLIKSRPERASPPETNEHMHRCSRMWRVAFFTANVNIGAVMRMNMYYESLGIGNDHSDERWLTLKVIL